MLKLFIAIVAAFWLLGTLSFYAFPLYLHAAAFLTAGFLLRKQWHISHPVPAQIFEGGSRDDHRYSI